jgi:hypothetical protein
MKQLFFASVLCSFCLCVTAQCIKPVPLTAQQAQTITGMWKLQYNYHNKQYDAEIRIRAIGNNEVACDISKPPIPGKETACEYFFCPGGEFHLKKYIGETAYVFQGTPENGHMKGLLSIYDKNNKRTLVGHFTMDKVN